MIDKNEAESFLSSAESHGFFRNEKFTSRANYEQFIKLLLEQLWEKFNFKSYRKMLHDYFTDLIDENDILFDIGYSGRTECALKNILGYAPESYYKPWMGLHPGKKQKWDNLLVWNIRNIIYL